MNQSQDFEFLRSETHGKIDVTHLQQAIIEWAVKIFNVFAGEIHIWDEEDGVLRQFFPVGSERYRDTVLKPGEGLTGRVFLSGEPAYINDYNTWEGRSGEYSTIPPNTAVLAVPMKVNDRVIGVLDLSSNGLQRPFNPEDLSLATLFANLSAVALEIARIHEVFRVRAEMIRQALEQEVIQRTSELTRRAKQMELSAQVSRKITSILDIDSLLREVVRHISDAFGYYAVQIFILDPDQSTLELRASSARGSGRKEAGKISLPLDGNSLNGRAACQLSGLIVPDVKKEASFFPSFTFPKTRSELVVPLIVGERLIGTLDVQSDQLDAFSSQDYLVFQSLAGQIAIAIDNARHMARVKEMAILEERYRIAHELQDAITHTLFSASLISDAIPGVLSRDPQKGRQLLQQQSMLNRGAFENMLTLNRVFTLQNHYDLTKREYEVLALMVSGQTNQEIAAELHISRATVKTHVGNILSKLGVNNRMEAISFVLRQND